MTRQQVLKKHAFLHLCVYLPVVINQLKYLEAGGFHTMLRAVIKYFYLDKVIALHGYFIC